MTSIRRLLSGISSSAVSWARYEVTAPIRQKPTAPVEPVRRGFSDHSDFQSAEEAERSPLDAHAPQLAGRERRALDPLSAYTGRSDFQARLPRYQHLLGTNVPPPPKRYWESARAQTPNAAPQQEPESMKAGARTSLTAPTDLEQAFELAGEDDSVLLYKGEGDAGGRSVVQRSDGSVTDPAEPDKRFASTEEWEQAHPDLSQTVSLSRNDAELVLAMPEGEARDEILAELAAPETSTASSQANASRDDFMPSLDDLPTNAEPEPETGNSDGFMPSLDDLPGDGGQVEQLLAAAEDSVPLSPEELDGQLSPTGELAEGRSPMDVASLVARRGTPEMQARVATTLHDRSRTPDLPEAAAWSRGAALAASASPEASAAFLQHVGEAQLADFVRSVMQS
ncbi:hypothetical protein [Hyalangium versicolor]|uniref:hypothetical protein n=1 Tax=Hyalangium versicolor TaxID=2861190 RepID=UPI001CCA9176|nr:hypothetical protein [Hyalangium versicolor]